MQATATSRALSIPTIVSLILSYRCLLEPIPLQSELLSPSTQQIQLPPSYTALCSTALISQPFKHESQVLLNQTLYFYKGTEQLTKWLQGGNGGKWKNEKVIFLDQWPFKEGKQGKWDFDVVGKVIEGLTEVRSLVLSFMGQVEIPAELICYKSCKDIDNLVLASPLSFSSSTTLEPAFKKVPTFAPIDQYPSKIKRSWSSTFSFLASHKITSTQLDLTHFPLYSQYLMPHLYPLAWSLIELHLPRLELGGLFAFAQGCINLENLSIKTIDISSIPALCQLLVFPPTLKAIHVDHLEGSNVGYFSLSKEQEDKDTITHFLDTLEKMLSTMEIKVLQIGTIKQVMGEHRRRLEKLKEKGLEVEVYHVDNARSEEETKEFIKVLQDSLQASVKSATSDLQTPSSHKVSVEQASLEPQGTQKGADSNGLDEKVKTNGNEIDTKLEMNGNAINGDMVDVKEGK